MGNLRNPYKILVGILHWKLFKRPRHGEHGDELLASIKAGNFVTS
jgi:hypothetical protein